MYLSWPNIVQAIQLRGCKAICIQKSLNTSFILVLFSHNAAALGYVPYDFYIEKLSEPQILQLFTCPCDFSTALIFNNLEK